jgi:hypothetical protein
LGEQGGIAPPGERRGAAAILAPEAPAAEPGKRGQAKNGPPKPAAKENQRSKPRQGQAAAPRAGRAGRAAAPAAKAPLPKPGISVFLVNETGQPRVADNYLAVLSQMGYQVVGVTNGTGQPPGQTVITYQPGRQAQAQALARRLPGQKVVVQAQGPIPAGAVVTIR